MLVESLDKLVKIIVKENKCKILLVQTDALPEM